MTTNEPVKAVKRLHRHHKLQREEVDAMPWPHPRPARDPRLVWLHMSMIWVAGGQAIFGAPGQSVQGKSNFTQPALIVFGVALILCCLCYLYAAYCKSQYTSFGFEMAACIGFAGFLSIYGWYLIHSTPEWWLVYNAPFTIAIAVGNLVRGVILIRRLW